MKGANTTAVMLLSLPLWALRRDTGAAGSGQLTSKQQPEAVVNLTCAVVGGGTGVRCACACTVLRPGLHRFCIYEHPWQLTCLQHTVHWCKGWVHSMVPNGFRCHAPHMEHV